MWICLQALLVHRKGREARAHFSQLLMMGRRRMAYAMNESRVSRQLEPQCWKSASDEAGQSFEQLAASDCEFAGSCSTAAVQLQGGKCSLCIARDQRGA